MGVDQHTNRSFYLNHDTWDLELNDAGDIIISDDEGYVTAQNVCNECRRFINDTYFDFNVGIRYFENHLGHRLNNILLMSELREAAFRVSNVSEVDVVRVAFDSNLRRVTADLNITLLNGVNYAVNL